jgi:protein-tyrosine-phosphatase
MRELLYMFSEDAGFYAKVHRSKLLADAESPDLIIATAPVHMRRLEVLAPDVPRMLCSPVIADPAFGGEEAYGKAWSQICENAEKMAGWLREERG